MSNNNKTSLWHLLGKYEIVIPIIQRDYAQGRKGKEDLRLRLLKSLKNALDGNKEIKLDFVYGSVDNNRMTPLDGQQRLTTLWLLHWFIAFRAGKLMKQEVQDRLKKFYYATRPSSTEFCRRMVEEFGKISEKSSIKETSIVEHIKNRHWYYSYYKNDPTIRAILTMIGSNSDKEQKNDCLEQVFNNCDFDCYWKMLTGDGCPIQFYHQDMIGNDVPLVDDLYIKMNARGKQLTHFENFKAELIGYNQDKSCDSDDFKLDIAGNKKDQEFVSNLDNSWVNTFWPYRNKYNRVDEIYYKFINQFMLNYYLIKSNTKDIDKTSLYRLLMNDNTFHKIEDYAEVLDDSFKSMLLNTLNGVAKLCNIKQGINDYIKGEILSGYNQFAFIPEYSNNGNDNDNDQDNLPTTKLTQIEQVLFFAICRFLEKWSGSNNHTPFPEGGLKDWVRFCHNISYNPLVNTVEGLQGALRVIDEISGKRNILNIYDSLADINSYNAMELKSQVASEQIEEEIIKAKYQQQEPGLKARFIEAEKYSFFKGCIRFLLWNDKGEYNKDFFDDKFENAKKRFHQDDTLDGKISNKDCFVEYFCSCTRLEDIISNDNNGNNCIRFNNSGEVWKYMLSNKELCTATHNFLCNTNASQNSCSIKAVGEDKERLSFVTKMVRESNFIEKLEKMGDIVSGVLFLRRNYEWALYPKNAKADKKVIVLGTSRNSVLKQLLNEEAISTGNNIEGSSLFYGWDIPFTYNEKEFLWKWNNVIVHNEKTIEISYNSTYEAIKQKLDEAVKSN